MITRKTRLLIDITELQEKPFYHIKAKYKLFKLRKELDQIIFKESPEYIRELLDELKKYQEKPKPPKLPRCNCRDVNECDTWCIGKENYTKHH